MKKNLLFICALLAATGVSLVITSCKDADDVQDITLSQVLSPTNLTLEPNADISVTASWSEMFNADSYELVISEDPNFADATQQVYSEIIEKPYTKGESCIVTIKGLESECQYYARLKALSSKGVMESKYVYAEVVTPEEQITQSIAKTDITDHGVTIHWTAGESFKNIEVIDINGDVVKTVVPTDTDIENGKMTITGLKSHSTYTIRLVGNNGKTRGRRTFTTLMDITNATLITAAQGADGSWLAIVEGAAAGTTFALEPGDYVTDGATLKITNDVVIAAQDITKMPTLHTQISIDNNAALYCYYIHLTADSDEEAEAKELTPFPDQCFNFKSTGNTSSLDIEGCEIEGYAKGLVYINTATIVNQINIIESSIHDIPCNGGDFIDSRSGSWNTLNFKNNTVVNCFNSRDFLRSPSSAKSEGTANVENNTFYLCGNGEANYRLFYTQNPASTNNFKNNIVEGFNNKRGFTNNGNWGTIITANNVYFNCKNLKEKAEGNTENPAYFDDSAQELPTSPFKDAEEGDFRLTDPNLRLKQVGPSYWYEQDVEE